MRRWAQTVAAAVPAIATVAVLTACLNLSYTALLFGTAAPEVQGQGLLMVLISTIVLTVVGAYTSTLPVTMIAQDGALVAGLAAATASASAAMASGPPGAVAATFLAALSLNTLLCGLAMLLIGFARAGAVVRFVPLQVMAGLLATVGLSLLLGGLRVAVASAPDGLQAALLAPSAALHLLPAVLGGLILALMQSWLRSPWVMPALVAVGTALHHGVFTGLGISLGQQRAEGWLLPPPGPLSPSLPWLSLMSPGVDWAVLLSLAPASAALMAIAVITVMLNASGLELALRRDVDIDRDLRAHGLSNMMAALAGGVLGGNSITRSVLLARSGPGTRWVTAATGLVAGLTPLVYPDVLGLIPRPVMAAVLLQVGWGILKIWMIDVRRRLTWLEWLTVPAVLGVAIQFGLVAAVLAGLTLGCITFAVLYSSGSPIRARYRGDVARSHVDRPPRERDMLLAHADATLVLYLQGFLFFGTANRLLSEVRAEMQGAHGRLRHIVLDLSNIDGLDGSARNVLERLQQVVYAGGCTLHAAAPPAAAAPILASLSRDPVPMAVAPTLDAALEACERAVLDVHAAGPEERAPALAAELGAAGASILAAMEPVEVEAGTVLMRQGDLSNDLLFIEDGQASVTLQADGGTPVRVRAFGPGTMVGEVGFLLGLPRTATVTAETACRLLRLTRTAQQRLEAEQPEAALALQRLIVRKLSLRLLDKDQLIAALMRGARST